MSIYINLTKNEYPRHQGDIELRPNDQFEPVHWVDLPEYNSDTQVCYEGKPEQINGKWTMVWIVRDLTQDEIQIREEINKTILSRESENLTASGAAPDVI